MTRRFASLILAGLIACSPLALAQSPTSKTDVQVAPSVQVADGIPSSTAKTIEALMARVVPGATLKQIGKSPLPGIKTVVANESVYYVSDDGQYLLYGVLLDTKHHTNLTENIVSGLRTDALASIPERDIITFEPKHMKARYTITAFVDTDCPWCRAMYKNTEAYLKEGIAIRYVPWPRAGMQAPNLKQMQSVWCAKDPKKAYTAANEGKPVKPATCEAANDFPSLLALGNRLGINGTPAVYDESGRKLGGFVPPVQLLAKLQQLDQKEELSQVDE